MKLFQFLSVVPLMLLSHLCLAQMMANPAYFNPAFAGIQENPRASFQYQSQWPVQDWNSRNMISSIDMGLPSIHSGVGIAAQHEETVDGKIKRDYANMMYNYEIKLSQNRYLRIGGGPTIYREIVTDYQLFFRDLLIHNPELIKPEYISLTLDMNFGMLYYTDKFYLGLDMSNVLQTNFQFHGLSSVNVSGSRGLSIQTGYYFTRGQYVFNPYFLLAGAPGDYSHVCPGINIRRGIFSFGTSYPLESLNSINFLFGLSKGIFKICYIYGPTIKSFSKYGSQEISLVVQLNKLHPFSDKPMIGFLRNSL